MPSMEKSHFYLTLLLPVLCHGRITEIEQSPLDKQPPLIVQRQAPQSPDERILWSLFHAGKIDTLKRQIRDLQQRFPDWRVPIDLQKALRQSEINAIPAGLTRPSKRQVHSPVRNGCASIDRQWARAAAQLAQGHSTQAVNSYARIISRCKKPELIKATLEKASDLTNRDDYFELTTLALGTLPDVELQRLEYQWLKNAYLRRPTDKEDIPDNSLLLAAERFRDAEFAIVIAWRYFEQQAYRDAYVWFDKIGQWQPDNTDATLGKMLSLEKLGNIDAALALYLGKTADTELDEVAGRLYKSKAWQALKSSNLPQAEQYLAEARSVIGSKDLEIQEIEAWIADSRNEYAKAAALFDKLYRQSPSIEYARAYVRNQSRVNRKHLAQHAEQSGGPLLDEFEQLIGRNLYQRKQFLAAQALTPTQFPNLADIDSPSTELGVYARHKSGEAGLGRLDIVKMPTGGGEFTVNGIHHFRLNLSRVELDSGQPAFCSTPLGTLAPDSFNGCANNFRGQFSPTDHLNNALETDFLYRMDGWFSPYIRLGHTPTGGVIDPTITFDVGFVQQTATGLWSLNVYSQPVRQSMLSYTGISDPYQSQTVGLNTGTNQYHWGRVLRSGVKAAGYHQFNKHWGIFASAEVAMLNGKNVADNTAFAASVNPGYNFPLPGFDYFSIGPALAYEHYEKNLSHFTLGHGGYFSPAHYINAGLGVQFLSEEGRPLVFKGHVSAGMQFTKQADAPWFPTLAPGLGTYQDDSGFSLTDALDIELKGVWLLAPNLQLGAGAAVRHTANYEDFTGGLFVRVFFKDRKASYSRDIPDAMFDNILFY